MHGHLSVLKVNLPFPLIVRRFSDLKIQYKISRFLFLHRLRACISQLGEHSAAPVSHLVAGLQNNQQLSCSWASKRNRTTSGFYRHCASAKFVHSPTMGHQSLFLGGRARAHGAESDTLGAVSHKLLIQHHVLEN
jgi:hypothetical protein